MARRDRQCMCCQSKYKYCPTCGQDKTKPSWMTQFCSESCKELWKTATQFNMKLIEKSEAKEIIENLELRERTAYVQCVQRDLRNILGEDSIVVEEDSQVLVEMPIITETPMIEEDSIAIEESVIVESPAVEEPASILVEEPVFVPRKRQKSHEVVKKNRK